jgi:ribonuclease HII
MNNGLIEIGIDEVGRGPVAGPVVLCAFAITPTFDRTLLTGIRDSKKLSAKKREEWDRKLREWSTVGSCSFTLAERTASFIDEKGIAVAIRECVAELLATIAPRPEKVFVRMDGSLHAPEKYLNQETIIKGDDLIPVISAASIIAKVYRDAFMTAQDSQYPGYGLSGHKGYGTSAHLDAIRQKGITPLHRASFLGNTLKNK